MRVLQNSAIVTMVGLSAEKLNKNINKATELRRWMWLRACKPHREGWAFGDAYWRRGGLSDYYCRFSISLFYIISIFIEMGLSESHLPSLQWVAIGRPILMTRFRQQWLFHTMARDDIEILLTISRWLIRIDGILKSEWVEHSIINPYCAQPQ